MFTATPTYSATTPRANKQAPELSSVTTIVDAQPVTGIWPLKRAMTIATASRNPMVAKTTPRMLTSRSIPVPPVSTMRQ